MTSPILAPSTARGDAATLTPSEQLLLAAATTPAPTQAEPWLHAPATAQVVEAVAAALLANEQAGFLAFEAGTRKRWLGLKTVAALYARPTERAATAAWPAGSLEARLLESAVKLAAKGKHHVGAVAEDCIPYDTAPESEVVDRAWTALKARDLVGVVTREKTTLKVFRSKQSHDVLSPDGAALRARTGAGAARALVEGCVRGRAELWTTLVAETTAAFTRQTQPENNGGNDVGSSD